MSEKKQVLYDLRFTYSGPFSVEEFYKSVDGWASERGYAKETKKKLEHVTKSGRQVHWVIELQSHLSEIHHGVLVLRAYFDNVKEITIKRGGKKITINSGDAMIQLDAFIEAHVHGSFYQLKPVFYFIVTLIDRFIYNFWSDKYDGTVNSQARDLFKAVQSYFNVQKYKYE